MSVVSIDDSGLARRTLAQIFTDLVVKVQTIFSGDIPSDSPEGRLLMVFAGAVSEMAGLLDEVYRARSPSVASGAALSRLVEIAGIRRKPPAPSTATVTLSGVSGTLVPAGSIVQSTSLPATDWTTTTDLVIPGGDTGSVSGQVVCSVTGPVRAMAGTLTKIGTVIAGWNGVTNAADAIPGAEGETDAQLRQRRARSVAIASAGNVDGMVGMIAQVAGIQAVSVFENPGDTVDTNGLPPHSIQVVVAGGLDVDVAKAIYLKRALGCTMVGATVVNIPDAQGQFKAIRFDRPTEVPIYVTVTLLAAAGSATKDAIKGALVDAGTVGTTIGGAVSWAALFGPVLGALAGSGISPTSIWLGTAPSPTLQQDAAIGLTSIASWDAGRIAVLP